MLGRIGFEPAPMAPAKFDAFVRSETEIWRTVVKAANIQPE
jgi:tripartite-type tricarboxylate transporter receptor subunit TctC